MVDNVESWIEYIDKQNNEILENNKNIWTSWLKDPNTFLLDHDDRVAFNNKIIDRNNDLGKEIREVLSTQFSTSAMMMTSSLDSPPPSPDTATDVYFLNMSWSNILCFGNSNYFEFGGCKPAPVAACKYLFANNGHGKTSFLEVILIALFGQGIASKMVKSSHISILNKSTTVGFTHILIRIQNINYIIKRTFINKNNKLAVDPKETYVYNATAQQQIVCGKNDVDAWVCETIGGDIDSFLMTNMIIDDPIDFDMQQIDTKLCELFALEKSNAMLLLLKSAKAMYKYIADHAAGATKVLKEQMQHAFDEEAYNAVREEHDQLLAEIEKEKKKIVNIEDTTADDFNDIMLKLQILRERSKKVYENKIKRGEPDRRKFASYYGVSAEELQCRIAAIQSSGDLLLPMADVLSYWDDYDVYVEEKLSTETIDAEIELLRLKTAGLHEGDGSDIEAAFSFHPDCEACAKNMIEFKKSTWSRKAVTQKELNALQNKIDHWKEVFERIHLIKLDLEHDIGVYKRFKCSKTDIQYYYHLEHVKEYDEWDQKLKTIHNDISVLEAQMKEKERAKNAQGKLNKQIVSGIKSMKARAQTCLCKLEVIKEQKNQYTALLQKLEAYEAYAAYVLLRKDVVDHLYNTFIGFKQWAFETRIIPDFVSRLNEYLLILCKNHRPLSFVVTPGTSFANYFVLDGSLSLPVKKCSTFQRFTINLATRLALQFMKAGGGNRAAARRVMFLGVDEAFTSICDQQNMDSVFVLLKTISPMYTNIVVTSCQNFKLANFVLDNKDVIYIARNDEQGTSQIQYNS